MSEVLQTLLYGLLAAASPGTLVATLAVLGTRRARANGSAFAVGFVLGQSATLAGVLVVGSITIPTGGGGSASAALELAVGVLLLAAGFRARRPRKPRVVGGSSRAKRFHERLERVTPRTAFSIGVTLGIGVKRLIITIFAASTIALASVTKAAQAGLGALYVVVASVLVWAPVTVYLVAGSTADEFVARSKERLAARQRQVTSLTSLLFGLVFVVGGLVQLL